MFTFGKCTNCGKEVESPNFTCPTGEQHIVQPKRYYMDDAPVDPGPYVPGPGGAYVSAGMHLRDSQTTICNLVPSQRERVGHEVIERPGRNVVFRRGIYETTDPEEQYYLDKRVKEGRGLCSEARWEEVYLTEQQKIDIQRQKLNADMRRLEHERNDLLAQVKKSQRA